MNQEPSNELAELGGAATQVAHDLKNQLSGLKLYATFLVKRAEKDAARADELETLHKIIAGLDRATAEMNALVRYGRPLALKKQRGDLLKVVQTAGGAPLKAEGETFAAEFDATLLAEALQTLFAATRVAPPEQTAQQDRAERRDSDDAPLHVRRLKGDAGAAQQAIIEWRGAAGVWDARQPFRAFKGASGARLALASKIIRAHGGTVESEAGEFRVTLPLTAQS